MCATIENHQNCSFEILSTGNHSYHCCLLDFGSCPDLLLNITRYKQCNKLSENLYQSDSLRLLNYRKISTILMKIYWSVICFILFMMAVSYVYTLVNGHRRDSRMQRSTAGNYVTLVHKILSRIIMLSVLIVFHLPWALYYFVELELVYFHYFNVVIYINIGLYPYIYYVRVKNIRESFSQLLRQYWCQRQDEGQEL